MQKEISTNIFKLYYDYMQSNVFVIKLDKVIIIDTTAKENREELLEDLKEIGLGPKDIDIVLLTHHHFDHIGNLDLFSEAKVFDFENKDDIQIDGMKVFETPGHTKDSISFLYKDILFSGDTMFDHGHIGRTDFKESVPDEMQNSLSLLKESGFKILCPGHDY